MFKPINLSINNFISISSIIDNISSKILVILLPNIEISGTVDELSSIVDTLSSTIYGYNTNIDIISGNLDITSSNLNANLNKNTNNLNIISGNLGIVSSDLNIKSSILNTVSNNLNTTTNNLEIVSSNLNTNINNLSITLNNLNIVSSNLELVSGNLYNSTFNLNIISGKLDSLTLNVNSVKTNLNTTSSNLNLVSSNLNTNINNLNTTTNNLEIVSSKLNIISSYVYNIDTNHINIINTNNNAISILSSGYDRAIKLNINTNDKFLSQTSSGLSSTISLVKASVLSDSANNIALYYLVDKNNNQVGARINIPKDQFLNKVLFIDGSGSSDDLLRFTFNVLSGTSIIDVPLNGLFNEYIEGNGISLTSNSTGIIIASKKDSSSLNFLTIGTDGIKISGIQSAINTAVSTSGSFLSGAIGSGYNSNNTIKSAITTNAENISTLSNKINEISGITSGFSTTNLLLTLNKNLYINGNISSKGSKITLMITSIITPIDNNILKINLTTNANIRFNLNNLSTDHCINFEVWLIMPSTLVSFNFVGDIYWNTDNKFILNNTPAFNEVNTTYVINFRYDGSKLLANLAYTI